MDFHVDYAALAALLAMRWLPMSIVAATVHWFLLAGRHRRATVVAAALVLEICLAYVIVFAPVGDPSLRLRLVISFNEIGRFPVVAAFLAALITTSLLLVFVCLGWPRHNSSRPAPFRDAA